MFQNIFFCSFFFFSVLISQENILPKGFSEDEKFKMSQYLDQATHTTSLDIFTNPPDFSVRTMAEWEEIEALTIAWEGFEPILTEIVRNSVDECKVIIACDNPSEVQDYLEDNNVATENVEYLDVNTNSIWMRDYGQNTVYKNDVDSIYFVDWVYNRPRPYDNQAPLKMSNHLNSPYFSMDLEHAG